MSHIQGYKRFKGVQLMRGQNVRDLAGNSQATDTTGSEDADAQGREHSWFSPLGRLPLVTDRVRRTGVLKEAPGFFGAVGRALVMGPEQLSGRQRASYPWGHRPVLLALDQGRILLGPAESAEGSDGQAAEPLDLATAFKLKSHDLLNYTEADYHQYPTLLWAGCRAPASGLLTDISDEQPALALTGAFERFLDLGQLNLQGLENEEESTADVLAARTGGTWVPVRDYAGYGYSGQGPAFEWGEVLVAAASLASWHRATGFDAATGQPTYARCGGWVRSAENGRELFPRTDPAVITAVTAQSEGTEKILLGQARAWGPGRFSTFAGFVEGGEALETAVLREVYEECGGHVASLRYVGSQPWPFPRSLMCGFLAELSNPQQVRADGAEIETLRWFSRDELVAAYRHQQVILPGPSSISRRLIELWLGFSLDTES
ncbi:NAD(+) diphosphatase [Rothia nasimurium]|uniref:NAD(+) diphosphatase n=1 Tax=Rothia nasimurium TaxID=85336 RepID=UPI0009F18715|nr:NAD(+) diphosphatase [Rothia nasimurium]